MPSKNRRKKVLVCAESSSVSSGFGTYTKEVLSRLYDSQKYELAELSSYCSTDNAPDVPWKLYPNAPIPSDIEEYKKYKKVASNAFGQWRFDKTLLDFKPDIVFDIRDYWMIAWQELSVLRPYFKWVIAPTVDSIPQQNAWLHTFKNADVVMGHTDWAVNYLKDCDRNICTDVSISDSVDTDIYKPISCSKTYHKAKLLAPKDSFIVGFVARNQKRKLIPNLMSVIKNFSLYAKRTNVYLHLHTSYPEGVGWDIPNYLQEFDVHNKVLFTYICRKCKKTHVSTFSGEKKHCPFCKEQTATFPNVIDGLTQHQLADIYNLFDLYVQYAICEGCGIPQLEAAACGVPVCSVDYSAMSEVTTKLKASKIPYALFKEMESQAWRAIPNDSALVQLIHQMANKSPSQISDIKKEIRNNVIENYSWDMTTERIMSVFDKTEPLDLWDTPLKTDIANPVPKDIPSDRKFVEYIIYNVIKSPHLYNTNYIQSLIKDLCSGFTISDNKVSGFGREEMVKLLEAFLNNKINLEHIRCGETKLDDNFIKFANKNK